MSSFIKMYIYTYNFFHLFFCAVPSKVYPLEDISVIEGENRTLTLMFPEVLC